MLDAPKSLAGFVDCKYLVEKRFRPGETGIFLQNDPVKSEICLVKVYLPEGDVSAADGDPMNILGVTFHDDRTVAEKEKFLENNGIVINDYVEGVMDKMASIGEWAVARLEAKVQAKVQAKVEKQFEERVAQQVAEKEEEVKTQMAEKMLHQGLSAEVVQKISGLNPAVVDRLSAASQAARL